MKKPIKYIRETLSELYDIQEVDSFYYLIIDHLTGLSKSEILITPDFSLSIADFHKLEEITERLSRFEPIQYILGRSEFYGLPLLVEPGVLIPRFETEELVDLIIKRNFNCKSLKILDIGCGSGCIAISLKKNLPSAEVWCCDISAKALEVTNRNAEFNNVKIKALQFDILSGQMFEEMGFNLIVSNPPYITHEEKVLMSKNVLDYEPELALFVPVEEPLVFYKAIVAHSRELLCPGGDIYFEINESFGHEVVGLMIKEGFKSEIIKDINGKDRIVTGRLY